MSINVSIGLRGNKNTCNEPIRSESNSDSEEFSLASESKNGPIDPDDYLDDTIPFPFGKSMANSIDAFSATSGIPEFTGNPCELERFLHLSDIQFERCNTDEYNSNFIKAIAARISGRAYSQTIQYQKPSSWADLRLSLVSNFSQIRDVQLVQNDIFQLFQKVKEDVVSYGARAESLLDELNNASMPQLAVAAQDSVRNWNEKTVTNKFVQGLRENLRVMVRTARVDTLREAVRLAIDEEKVIQLQVKHTAQKFCQNCRTNTHNTVECRRQPNTPNPRYRNFLHYTDPSNNNTSNQISNNQTQSQPQLHKFQQPLFNQPNSYLANALFQTAEPPLPNKINSENVKFCRYCKKKGHELQECTRRKFNNNNFRQGNEPQPGPSTQ